MAKPPIIQGKKNSIPTKKNQQSEALKIFLQGFELHQKGLLAQAKEIYERALIKDSNNFDALHMMGVIALQQKEIDSAEFYISKAIKINQNSAAAYSNLGIVLYERRQFDEALKSLDAAIAINPNYAEAFCNRGNVFKQLKYFDEAIQSYRKAIQIKANYAEAFNNLGLAQQKIKQFHNALESFEGAILIRPDYIEALNNHGNALIDLGRPNEALVSYERAIGLNPAYDESLYTRGNVLRDLGRYELALESYEKAISIKGNFAAAYNNSGLVLQKINRTEDAVANFDKAISIEPDYADAYNNRGISLKELGRLADAMASYISAISIKPNFAEALFNLGDVCHTLNRFDDAVSNYNKALAIKPDLDFLFGLKMHAQAQICDWSELQEQLHLLESLIDDGVKIAQPFHVIGLIDEPKIQFKSAKLYVDAKFPPSQKFESNKKYTSNDKICIGYYSADFRDHPVAHLSAELFEMHDKNKFELIGFYFGPADSSDVHKRVASSFDKFIDVSNKSDREVAEISRFVGVDIAIDLGGFTKNSRSGIFAERCAPIQVNYLGYLGTMAADFMDYICADKTLIPEESQQFYTEKILYLPNSYQANDSKRKISDKIFTKEELGLPANGFIYCCFNNNFKILPTTFDCWMRILKAVSGSVLWLLEDNPMAAINLRKEAEIRGVDASRIVFAKRMKMEDHLARHRVADLFIDTLPCNAGTTASDALWAGLPILTLLGKSFAGRIAASLLNGMNMPELIARNQEEYEFKAVEFANNPSLLFDLKEKIIRNRYESSLYNTKLLTTHLEAGYKEMHRRYVAGEVPANIYVSL